MSPRRTRASANPFTAVIAAVLLSSSATAQDVSLREHYDAVIDLRGRRTDDRFAGLERFIESRHAEAKEAIEKTATAGEAVQRENRASFSALRDETAALRESITAGTAASNQGRYLFNGFFLVGGFIIAALGFWTRRRESVNVDAKVRTTR